MTIPYVNEFTLGSLVSGGCVSFRGDAEKEEEKEVRRRWARQKTRGISISENTNLARVSEIHGLE